MKTFKAAALSITLALLSFSAAFFYYRQAEYEHRFNGAQGKALDRRISSRERRQQSIYSFMHGCLHPRRATNRRAADDQHFMVDVYDPGLIMFGLAIVLMSCLDAFFTLRLLSMGASEINYFMKALIETDVSTFLTIKLLATCSGVVFLTATARYKLGGVLRVRRILEGLCGIYACLIVWELYLLVAVASHYVG